MGIKFTPEQEQVIRLHDCNALVSAAAGSGKTAVLVERIVRMVCDGDHPVDIDRLLVVTFTNAAAAEMRERVAAGIADRLREHPESEHIQRQSTLLHNAQITTIDSFSLFILRNHFYEIGLDPAFRVADESEVKLLQQDVLAQLLEEAYAEHGEEFLHCVEYFCPGGRESVLENHILDLSRYASSFPWPEDWLLGRKNDYAAATAEELLQGDCGIYLKKYIDRMLDGCISKMEEVKRLCESPDGPYMYGELAENELENLRALRQKDEWKEYSLLIPALEFGRLSSKKDDSVSPVKRELAKTIRSQVKEILQDMGEKFFGASLELAARQSAECAAPIGTLIDLTLEFDRRMKESKQQKKIIDFSDMEHYALEILIKKDGETMSPSPVALEYRQFFHEILIDEYQDSNLVQEYLLQAISGEEEGRFNRFMVGDVKQSIYKFRLARPEIFLEKYDSYTADEGDYRRIDLAKNFRSRAQVVDAVNSFFARVMSRTIGGIDYDDRAALYAGADFPEAQGTESEFLLVEKPSKGGELGAKEAEALAIAGRIRELGGSFLVTDKESGNLRPLRYSDIVILLRSNSGWDEEFKAVLEREGIPVYITSKTGYFAAPEVQELLQVLRVLDNPSQDIPLFGMMKSVFGGFTEEEIAIIRSGRKKVSLYEALCGWGGHAESDDDGVGKGDTEQVGMLREKAARFLGKIKAYRACTVYMPIRDLLQKLVEEHDYLNYVTALPAGGKRRANVEMLFTKASDFEKTSYFGLFHFVRYIEQLEKYDVDYGEADVLDENADVVRIMSIHKSKGLEFPVTFVAGLAKKFNMQDVNQALIVDMDLGLGTNYVDTSRRITNKTLRKTVLACKMREDNLAEELRVLYVAMTRAKEKLIMTAALEELEEKWNLMRENAAQYLTYPDYIKAGSYLDFLLPVLGQTALQVKLVLLENLAKEELEDQVQMAERLRLLKQSERYAGQEELQKVRERFAFVYPYQNLKNLYTKTTVSELKIAAMEEKDEAAYHAFEEEEVIPYIPAFRREQETVSGAVRGTAFHRAMELLDFMELLGGQFASFPDTYEAYEKGLDSRRMERELRMFLEEKTKELRLKKEYYEALSLKKLVHFLQTPLAYRMWAAQQRGELYREQPFVLGVDAGRLGADFPLEEKVLIQGIIDVFFVENGELTLLDYKTDVVATPEELWNRYEVQMDYYREALANIMQMPVRERVLYSFYLGVSSARE